MSYSLNDPQTVGTVRYFFWDGYSAYVDHLIVTKGAARYTSTFTPSCPVGASDPLWSNVVLYLDFEGANGSTTITDAKGHTIANSGPLALSTAQSSCGTSSLYLSGGQISIASYTPDFDLGTGDFCIESKLRFFDITGYDWGAGDLNIFMVANISTPSGYTFAIGASGGEDAPVDTLAFAKFGVATIITGDIGALQNNVWYHVAVSRESGVFRLFFDGELIAEADTSSSSFSLVEIGTVTNSQFDFALIP